MNTVWCQILHCMHCASYFFDTLQMCAVRRVYRRGVSTLQYSGRLGSCSAAWQSCHSQYILNVEICEYNNKRHSNISTRYDLRGPL